MRDVERGGAVAALKAVDPVHAIEYDDALWVAEAADSWITDVDETVHEAKGRIMEGQDPKAVLVWVLSHISGEEVIL